MNKNGFTLLEVTLFLAISGALALIAFVGLGPRLQNVRFTSAVRDLEKSIISNLDSSQKGQNSRQAITSCAVNGDKIEVRTEPEAGPSSSAGGAGNCVLNGVIAIIPASNQSVIYRDIVSLRNPRTGCAGEGFNAIIDCHRSTILNQDKVIYQYRDGLQRKAGQRSIAPSTNYTGDIGFGYIQDPNSTQIYRFIATPRILFYGSLQNSMNIDQGPNDSFSICYGLGSREAKFTFKNTAMQPTVVMNEGCGA